MRPGSILNVDVDVTNTGKVAGDEITQLYIRDDVGSVTRPVMELHGFRRVRLAPGETRKIAFPISVNDLAFYNSSLVRVAEPGSFTAFVGGSSTNTQQLKFRLETPDGRPVRVPSTCDSVN